jgi:HAD superfamily hydrolase (TIGR01490 family)
VKVHIFDVDFTIVRCSTVRAFIFRGMRVGLIGASIGFYAPLLFLRYGLKGSSGRSDQRAYPFLKDVSRAELEAMAAELFDEVFRPKLDAAVAGRIETILQCGGKAIIASSSFGTIIEPLARHLGISDIVASELEFRDGASTGRVAGEPAFGEGKRSRVLAYLRTIGAEPGECAFYSDSHRDLPLFREVGEAVAVNPDARLRRVARERGWEIFTTKSALKEVGHA